MDCWAKLSFILVQAKLTSESCCQSFQHFAGFLPEYSLLPNVDADFEGYGNDDYGSSDDDNDVSNLDAAHQDMRGRRRDRKELLPVGEQRVAGGRGIGCHDPQHQHA